MIGAGSFRLLGLLLAAWWPAAILAAPPVPVDVHSTSTGPDGTRVTVRFEQPHLEVTARGTQVMVDGCLPDLTPGAPMLPTRSLTLSVPAGCRARAIRIQGDTPTVIPLEQPVHHADEPVAYSRFDRPAVPVRRNAAIYARATPYPDWDAPVAQRVRHDRLHGETLLTIVLYPVQYLPARALLHAHRELTVQVDWAADPAAADARRWRPAHTRPRDEAHARAATSPLRISPPSPALRLEPPAATGTGDAIIDGGASAEGTDAAALPVLQEPGGPFEHVIIAPAAFIADTPAPWNLAALSAARQASGLNSTAVSIEWIQTQYAGRDGAERMRAFIRDAYDQWETRYVLLVGTPALVPTRKLYCSFSAATDLIPADGVYFGCLDGSFDGDGDGIYGEIGDGDDGGDVDLVAEVFVGRFPAASTGEVSRLVRKTLTYEARQPEALRSVTHVGEWLGFGGPAEYATGAMEQIRIGAGSGGFNSLGFQTSYLNASLDTLDTLYGNCSGSRREADGYLREVGGQIRPVRRAMVTRC